MENKPPVFIIGNARSGTSLLRLMLTSHKNIVIVPECGFSVWLYRWFKDWKWDKKKLTDDFLPALFNCRKIETWGLERDGLLDYIISRKPDNYTQLTETVYEKYALNQKPDYKRWGDKNTFYTCEIKTIDLLYKSCLFIHIVRDGRDAACSYKELKRRKIKSKYAPKLPFRINDIAGQWNRTERKINHDLSRLDKDRYITVKYEDLVLYPEKTLKVICDFLDEPYDPNMQNYYIYNQKHKIEPEEFLSWKEKTVKPPDIRSVSRYKKELTDRQIRIFENISGKMLRKYNYI